MFISFKTNINTSPANQTQILEILTKLSEKVGAGLYYSEENGVYRIKIAKPFPQYEVAASDLSPKKLDVAKLQNDIEQILKDKHKDLILSDAKSFILLDQSDRSLRDALLARFKKISYVDKDQQLQAVASSTQVRLYAIENRHDKIFKQYKESALKKLEAESSRSIPGSAFDSSSSFTGSSVHSSFLRSAFDQHNRISSSHFGISQAGGSRGMSQLDHFEREEKERRARVEEQNRRLMLEEKERRARVEEQNKRLMLEEKERHAKIDAQNKRLILDSELSRKEQSTSQKICIDQEQTLINFFSIANQLDEKLIDSKSVRLTWISSFHGQSSSELKAESQPTEEGKKPGLTINFLRSIPLMPRWDGTDELLVEAELMQNQLENFIFCSSCATKSLREKNMFSITFTDATEENFSPSRLQIALLEAGIENLYSISKITFALAPKSKKGIDEETKSASLSSALPRLSFGSPISAKGDAHANLMNELKPYQGRTEFSLALQAAGEFKYAQALRRSCTDPAAIAITEIILKHHKTLKFDINEIAGADQQAAIHHAGRKHNDAAYALLVKHGAKEDLTDKAGLTGQAYFRSKPKR